MQNFLKLSFPSFLCFFPLCDFTSLLKILSFLLLILFQILLLMLLLLLLGCFLIFSTRFHFSIVQFFQFSSLQNLIDLISCLISFLSENAVSYLKVYGRKEEKKNEWMSECAMKKEIRENEIKMGIRNRHPRQTECLSSLKIWLLFHYLSHFFSSFFFCWFYCC